MTAALEVRSIGGLLREAQARGWAAPMSCYQCAKCSCGCPVASTSDLKPHELVRLMQLDQTDAVLSSRFIWACTSCHTCAARCPQNVDIAGLNDILRAMSRAAGMAAGTATTPVFNDIFLNSVRKHGRVHELGLMASFKLRTGRWMEDVDKAPLMLSKGKLPLFGKKVRGEQERKAMFDRAAEGGDR